MTIEELKHESREFISVYDAASIMECDPQRLRDALDLDDERPIAERRFVFPHCKVGSKRRIARIGFIAWVEGNWVPAVYHWKAQGAEDRGYAP